MKGKIAFILGAAVGYVLGTRAGRERYEQIKRGAQRVWHTEPVQRGVTLVKDAVDDRAEDLKVFAIRVGNDVFSNLMQKTSKQKQNRSTPSGDASESAEASAETSTESADTDRDKESNSPADTEPASQRKAKDSKSSDSKSSGSKASGSKAAPSRSSSARRTPKATS